MLVLSRKPGEKIYIGDNICVTVVDISRGRIRLGVEAPSEVPVHRKEVHDAIRGACLVEAEQVEARAANQREEEEDVRSREVILFGEDGSVELLSVR
jgi:carbon storage regulator